MLPCEGGRTARIKPGAIDGILIFQGHEESRIAGAQELRGNVKEILGLQAQGPRTNFAAEGLPPGDRRRAQPDQRVFSPVHSNGNRPDLFLQYKTLEAFRYDALRQQDVARTYRGMTGEIHLFHRCKYPH